MKKNSMPRKVSFSPDFNHRSLPLHELKRNTKNARPHLSPRLPPSGLSLEPTKQFCSVGNTLYNPMASDFPESCKGSVTQIDNLKVTKSLELNGLVTNFRLAA